MNDIIEQSVQLAETWQRQANEIKTSDEVAFDGKIAKMVKNPANKVFLTELIDQSFRPEDADRIADQITYLLNKYDDIDLFDAFERALIKVFLLAGRHLPQISVPAIIQRIRKQTASVILDGEPARLKKHIEKRRSENIGVNLNIIGEAILGEEEAEERMLIYEEALSRPEVTYISIKISTIYSQISSLAFRHTIRVLTERLSRIFRSAMEHTYTDESGKTAHKFINLDMEEYRDLPLTIEAFKRTLDQDEFKDLFAGIVLQAYLPDAVSWHDDLCAWARQRVEQGGSPIKMRLVKGANMDMEKTEASSKHWPQAPYHEKLDSDANFKRILRSALKPENARCVRVGVASHNLFELAHALLLAKELGTEKFLIIEMLEGMAGAAARALHQDGIPVLLYAPVATKENFTHAIAYYVRRLDENTSPQNFLTHAFNLIPGDEDWSYLADQFRASFEHIETAPKQAFRQQNRLVREDRTPHSTVHKDRFISEPDTDFTLKPNRQWARNIVQRWKDIQAGVITEIPVTVGDRHLYEALESKPVKNLAEYGSEKPLARYALATVEQIDEAVEIAASDQSGWMKLSHEERHAIMSRAAQNLRELRGDLIGVAAAEVGKCVSETDVEVSEAIDFAEFYPYSHRKLWRRKNLKFAGKGVGVIVPPWNFPIAIPAGGVIASLTSGNNTILKPAPQATYCSWILCQAFWDAGVPKDALQFLPCRNDPEASHLVAHPKVDFVIFTGSTQTALKMLEARPRLNLFAETGGKNAMVVSSVSDRDKAVIDIIQSAFSNTGQKCSATSLLLLQRPLFENAHFRKALADAAASLPQGSPWDLSSKIGPLANPLGGPLKQVIEEPINSSDFWALKPKVSPENPHMVSPGIIWNVSQKSYCYKTELFGPVLGVMPFDTIEEAVRIVNQTDFGLTSGIHSLDDREIEQWRESIRAGNLYINRGTTGAIVLRQPFGGMAKSAIGPGIKVGGHNYTLEFSNSIELGPPENRMANAPELTPFEPLLESFPGGLTSETEKAIRASFESAAYEYGALFGETEDYFKIRGEFNQSRYLRMQSILVRIEASDDAFSIFSRLFNAKLSGSKTIISVAPDCSDPFRQWMRLKALLLGMTYQEESQSDIADAIAQYERIRFASPEAVSDELVKKAASEGIYIACEAPHMDGRVELVLYFREQSVSHSYHRYGNLGYYQLTHQSDDIESPGEP
jgi:RHH-type proline utilization regulon transcriptional repressor/proline dehydrogenase/delta 1-pyrroline-5-carboxylate dehydrogenase